MGRQLLILLVFAERAHQRGIRAESRTGTNSSCHAELGVAGGASLLSLPVMSLARLLCEVDQLG